MITTLLQWKIEERISYQLSKKLVTKLINNTFQARVDILKIHSRKMNLTRGINLRKIAEKMSGASGAESKVKSPTK